MAAVIKQERDWIARAGGGPRLASRLEGFEVVVFSSKILILILLKSQNLVEWF